MTQRQEQILRAIVEQYVKTANPVGSLDLSRVFGYSPATIRADMALLEASGYLMHPHTSSGRIPTDKGYRNYVNALQNENKRLKQVPRLFKAIDHRITGAGGSVEAIRLAVDSLAEVTHNVGVATLSSHNVYMRGLTHLFTQPEFRVAVERIQEVAELLENFEPWLREIQPHSRISVWIGQENPIGKASGCALIISRFNSPYSSSNYIGVVGPTRQSYGDVMRLVGHISETLEGVVNE